MKKKKWIFLVFLILICCISIFAYKINEKKVFAREQLNIWDYEDKDNYTIALVDVYKFDTGGGPDKIAYIDNSTDSEKILEKLNNVRYYKIDDETKEHSLIMKYYLNFGLIDHRFTFWVRIYEYNDDYMLILGPPDRLAIHQYIIDKNDPLIIALEKVYSESDFHH